MNINAIKEAVKYNFMSPADLVPHIEGPVGIGKSDIVYELAKEIAEEQEMEFYSGPENYDKDKFGLIEIRPSQTEPSDYTGMPLPDQWS